MAYDDRLRKFDPFQMAPDLVRRVAVGRDGVLSELLEVVGENLATLEAPPQHLCLIAPRGTGKTFLLRLLGLEIADRAAGGEAVAFLHLPEEMPHVLSPISFLREIRRRLRGEGPAANAPRKHDDPSDWNGLAADIDAELSARFGEGRGLLVLCVENIKDVLRDAFPQVGQQRDLRAWLERPAGRIMLIAASSAGAFDREADKALFAIGRNIDLAPWTTAQTMEFLGRVMEARDGRGLRAEDERVARAITSFTSGSPRMAVALAEVLGAEDAMSAALTLDALIDNLQEYYLGRLKDMGGEAKRCIASLLIEGENASQTEVARRLGMLQSEVARVFGRLETDSVLVSDRLAGHKEKFYRVADRVFVHFYNVKVLYHGAERSVLAPILDFLVSAFTDDEPVDQAERLLSRGLRRDAVVLLSTLPVLDEVTIDYAWWTGVRGFLDLVADIVADRDEKAGEVVATLRRIVRDRGSAAAIAHKHAHGKSPQLRPNLKNLVAGLAYLAAGEVAQSRYWLTKITDDGEASWLTCISHLAKAYNGYVSGDIEVLITHARKAERTALDLNIADCLQMGLVCERYVASLRGDIDAVERISRKMVSEVDLPSHMIWLAGNGLRSLSRIAQSRGDIRRAAEYAERALEIAERSERKSSIALAKIRLADSALSDGRARDALNLADDAASICREEGDFHEWGNAIDVACNALRALGQPLDAVEKCRELVAMSERQVGPYLRARAYASLAFELSSWAMSPKAIRESEARAFADRALALLGDNPTLEWLRSPALEARLAVARAAGNDADRLGAAQDLAPVARRVGRHEVHAWALAELITARWNMKQNEACIDEAIDALAELVPAPGDLNANIRFIATKLASALRAEARFGELPAIFADLPGRINVAADPTRHAALARAFLPAAVELEDYAWGVDLADFLLRDGDIRGAPNEVERMDLMLACIVGAGAWERMAPHLDDAFWTAAAARLAGIDVADVLVRAESAGGRPAAYAVFRGAWTAMGRVEDEADARSRIMRALLTNRRMTTLSAGLLTDIAGTLAAEAPGRFDAEAAMLREFARFNASGRDPAMLASLNPDVATALRIADPSLQAPVLAPPADRKSAGKVKRVAKARR